MSEVSETKPKAFPTDITGKVEMAKQLKDLGNENFKDQLFKKAVTNYAKALAFTKGLPGRTQGLEGMSQMAMDSTGGEKISAEMESTVTDLDAVLKTNIATCYIKLNNSEKALLFAKEALALKPDSWKAKLRKAEAYMLMNDFDRALQVLDEADGNAPDQASHTSIQKTRERATKLSKQAAEKQRKAFGNIFDRARDESGGLYQDKDLKAKKK